MKMLRYQQRSLEGFRDQSVGRDHPRVAVAEPEACRQSQMVQGSSKWPDLFEFFVQQVCQPVVGELSFNTTSTR
jgi:hypothetical protein